jgi:predicted RNA binding protein YcfA (HicA-like mRNA interferase family)
VVSKIESLGGYSVGQRGSHAVYRAERDGLIVQTVVALHAGDVPNGTLRAIEKDLEPVLGKDGCDDLPGGSDP